MEPQENIAAYSKSYWTAEDCDFCGNNSAVDSVAGSEKHAHRNPMLDDEDEEVAIEVRWLDDANDPNPNHGHYEEFVGGVRRGCCSRRTRVVSAFGLLLLMTVAIVLGVTLSDVKEGKAGQSVSVQQQMLGESDFENAYKGTATEVERKGKEPKEPKNPAPKQLKTGTTIAQRYEGINVDPASPHKKGQVALKRGGDGANGAGKEPKAPGKVIKEVPNEEVPFKWTGTNGSRSRLRNARKGSGPGVKGPKPRRNDGSIASVPKGNNKLVFDSDGGEAQKAKGDPVVKGVKGLKGDQFEVPNVDLIKVVKGVKGEKAAKADKIKVAGAGNIAAKAAKADKGDKGDKTAKTAKADKAGKAGKTGKSSKTASVAFDGGGSGSGAAIHTNGRASGYTVLGKLRPWSVYTGPTAASLG